VDVAGKEDRRWKREEGGLKTEDGRRRGGRGSSKPNAEKHHKPNAEKLKS
jgi:hypothetical protein